MVDAYLCIRGAEKFSPPSETLPESQRQQKRNDKHLSPKPFHIYFDITFLLTGLTKMIYGAFYFHNRGKNHSFI